MLSLYLGTRLAVETREVNMDRKDTDPSRDDRFPVSEPQGNDDSAFDEGSDEEEEEDEILEDEENESDLPIR